MKMKTRLVLVEKKFATFRFYIVSDISEIFSLLLVMFTYEKTLIDQGILAFTFLASAMGLCGIDRLSNLKKSCILYQEKYLNKVLS